ncbi:hypothetical protein JW758_03165 [Candidatus Peregrinibacteria bacterium]|nr:hypothetical protein [Candidatus Peregrinibacteria bacterium]
MKSPASKKSPNGSTSKFAGIKRLNEKPIISERDRIFGLLKNAGIFAAVSGGAGLAGGAFAQYKYREATGYDPEWREKLNSPEHREEILKKIDQIFDEQEAKDSKPEEDAQNKDVKSVEEQKPEEVEQEEEGGILGGLKDMGKSATDKANELTGGIFGDVVDKAGDAGEVIMDGAGNLAGMGADKVKEIAKKELREVAKKEGPDAIIGIQENYYPGLEVVDNVAYWGGFTSTCLLTMILYVLGNYAKRKVMLRPEDKRLSKELAQTNRTINALVEATKKLEEENEKLKRMAASKKSVRRIVQEELGNSTEE